MDTSVPKRFCAATAPRQQMNSGWIIASWRSRYSRQLAASSGSGGAVARRPAAEDVENINVLAAHFHPFDDDVGQQLAGAAHERLAEPVFVGPGGLAAEDQPSVGIAHAEDGLGPRSGQFGAAGAGGHVAGDLRQGRRAGVSRRFACGTAALGCAGRHCHSRGRLCHRISPIPAPRGVLACFGPSSCV